METELTKNLICFIGVLTVCLICLGAVAYAIYKDWKGGNYGRGQSKSSQKGEDGKNSVR